MYLLCLDICIRTYNMLAIVCVYLHSMYIHVHKWIDRSAIFVNWGHRSRHLVKHRHGGFINRGTPLHHPVVMDDLDLVT